MLDLKTHNYLQCYQQHQEYWREFRLALQGIYKVSCGPTTLPRLPANSEYQRKHGGKLRQSKLVLNQPIRVARMSVCVCVSVCESVCYELAHLIFGILNPRPLPSTRGLCLMFDPRTLFFRLNSKPKLSSNRFDFKCISFPRRRATEL